MIGKWLDRKAFSRWVGGSAAEPRDTLTGLPVRPTFLKALNRICAIDGEDLEAALIIIDVVGCHQINLVHGDWVGDRVLTHVAERLLSVCREKDYAARIGDDQFALLLPGMLGEEHVLLATHKIASQFESAFVWGEVNILIRLRMGVCLRSEAGHGADRLFEGAMKALYRAKQGGESVAFYQEGDLLPEQCDSGLESDFNQAIANSELELVFQAKKDLQRSAICGAEALVRWRSRSRGHVEPRDIVAMASKTGNLDRLTFWVIDRALRACATWHERGLGMSVAVNLEASTFFNPLLPDQIADSLSLWRVSPARLVLEVTEATLMLRAVQVLENVKRLREVGVQVSIDDFGTGYSSLSYLNRLDVNELKIDKSFIDAMLNGERDLKLVESIILLGRGLGLTVTAEGVECADQYDTLKRLGCDVAQGFYVLKPMPLEQFAQRALEFRDGANRSSG